MSFPYSVSAPVDDRLAPQRRTARRVASREKWLAACASVQLVMLPWAFGGVDVPSQLISAVLGGAALALALRAGANTAGQLLRDPFFAAGLVLFGYVALQGANPSFGYEIAGADWWLEPRTHAAWLPAGMAVPFAQAGAWRTLLLWMPPWLLACALRHGVTRRSTATFLLNVIVANGFFVAAFGIVQRAAGTDAIYGMRRTLSADIFASFIYRNHAAAFLDLVTMAAATLALHALDRARQNGGRGSDLPPLYFIFAATALFAVVLTFSLAGVLFAAVCGATIVVVALVRARNRIRRSRAARVGLVATGGLALLVGGLALWAGRDQMAGELAPKFGHGGVSSWHQRLAADRAGWEMFQDRPMFGWGAGCFRYGFTGYQSLDPDISHAGSSSLFWEHLHNDWLELLVELGVIGILPLLAVAAAACGWLWRARFWRNPGMLCGALGLAILAAHAWIDFPLQNPAILTTAAALAALLPATSVGESPGHREASRAEVGRDSR